MIGNHYNYSLTYEPHEPNQYINRLKAESPNRKMLDPMMRVFFASERDSWMYTTTEQIKLIEKNIFQ